MSNADKIALGFRALHNGDGLAWRSEFCECDHDVGHSPCHYCALHEALQGASKLEEENKNLRAKLKCESQHHALTIDVLGQTRVERDRLLRMVCSRPPTGPVDDCRIHGLAQVILEEDRQAEAFEPEEGGTMKAEGAANV